MPYTFLHARRPLRFTPPRHRQHPSRLRTRLFGIHIPIMFIGFMFYQLSYVAAQANVPGVLGITAAIVLVTFFTTLYLCRPIEEELKEAKA